MRKYLFGFMLFFGSVSFCRADLFDMQRDKTVVVMSTISVSALSSTTTILIDLSSGTALNGWPHTGTREVNISNIEIAWDKLSTSSGSIKIGVLNFVNTSTGSVTWFKEFNNLSSAGSIPTFVNPFEGAWRLRVNPGVVQVSNLFADGVTPYFLTNDKLSGSSTFQTDVSLPSPIGQRFPGVGDIVATLTNNNVTSAMDVVLTIFYWTEAK